MLEVFSVDFAFELLYSLVREMLSVCGIVDVVNHKPTTPSVVISTS